MVKVAEGEYMECEIGGSNDVQKDDTPKNMRWGAHLEEIKI